jgi:biotin transport system permease protein
MISFYHPSGSFIHSLPAGFKLLALILLGTALFQVDQLQTMILCGVMVVLFFCLARVPFTVAFRQMRPALFLLTFVYIAQHIMVGAEVAVFVVLRFAILILGAGLITVTSRVSEMVDAIETGLKPFRRWIAIEKISLAITLAIRFIPVLGEIIREVRDAQKVRGMDRNLIAVLLPTIIRTLKMATEVAEALDARSFASQEKTGANK